MYKGKRISDVSIPEFIVKSLYPAFGYFAINLLACEMVLILSASLAGCPVEIKLIKTNMVSKAGFIIILGELDN